MIGTSGRIELVRPSKRPEDGRGNSPAAPRNVRGSVLYIPPASGS